MLALILAACLCLPHGDVLSCDPTPSASAAAFFHSAKVERGLVENPDPVFGYEAEVSFAFLRAAFEASHDLTDTNSRRFRDNEIAASAGLAFGLLSCVDITADCVFRHAPDADTSEVRLSAELPNPVVTPYLSAELDVRSAPGAAYFTAGLRRTFDLPVPSLPAETVSVTPFAALSCANAARNRPDMDADRPAARDISLGLHSEIRLSEHVSLCPCVTLYDQFTSSGRRTYRRGNGFLALASVHLKAEF